MATANLVGRVYGGDLDLDPHDTPLNLEEVVLVPESSFAGGG